MIPPILPCQCKLVQDSLICYPLSKKYDEAFTRYSQGKGYQITLATQDLIQKFLEEYVKPPSQAILKEGKTVYINLATEDYLAWLKGQVT